MNKLDFVWIYTVHEKILLAGDFNVQIGKSSIDDFLEAYGAKNLVKDFTCCKSANNPSCIDLLFITNNWNSFKSTTTVSTGLPDFHKMIVTVLKKQHYIEYFNEHVNNIKKTWDGIKKIVNVKKTSKKISQLTIGGKAIDNDKMLANNFNRFFVDVVPTTENSIPKVPNLSPSKLLKNRN